MVNAQPTPNAKSTPVAPQGSPADPDIERLYGLGNDICNLMQRWVFEREMDRSPPSSARLKAIHDVANAVVNAAIVYGKSHNDRAVKVRA